MLFFSSGKKLVIWAVLVLGLIFTVPNTGLVPGRTVNLGLDLRGGSHVLLGLDKEAFIRERLTPFWDEARDRLEKAHIAFKSGAPNAQTAQFLLEVKPAQVKEARAILEHVVASEEGRLTLAQVKGGFSVSIPKHVLEGEVARATKQSIEIIRRRIDALGTREPIIEPYGADRIIVEVPGLHNPDELVALLGKTAKLHFYLVDSRETVGKVVPHEDELFYMSIVRSDETARVPVLVKRNVMLDGAWLIDARAGFGQDGKPNIAFRFNATGSRVFANITRRYVGHAFAIVLDQDVLSTPVITEPILGGSGQITGHFTIEEASRLALLLRAGALPAPLKVLGQSAVGAHLGADSVRHGVIASLVGLGLVMGFMIVAYGLFGFFADIALLANLMLMIAALSLLQATLTLPGIAGIVLTLGMAVDANVLIFERMREERDAQASVPAALEAGYTKAWSTILDSNLTTLIATAILFLLGTGPIRGFAVTLMIGIATSLFTASTLNRFIVVAWFRQKRPKVLPL